MLGNDLFEDMIPDTNNEDTAKGFYTMQYN